MSDKAIPSFLATLVERLAGRETLELEFKAARGGLPKDLWPTISAFANTQGGWIVLGVSEQADAMVVDGVENPQALLHNFHSQLRNEQKISYETCKATDVAIEEIDHRQVIIIRVPAASRKARPVYTGGNPYGGTYVRRHSGDYHCTKQEVDRMMREASDVATDSAILRHFRWEDLEIETLTGYRRRYQTRAPASPWNGYDDRQFLRALGGYRIDRDGGEEGITVAGLLMFGKREALRDWRTHHLIDYRLVPDDSDVSVTWDDRIVWEDNLLGAFEAIHPRLVSGLPMPFRLEGATRIEESPLHIALREALVNLLVHADYSETQASLVVRSPQGYRFRNPGSSRVAEADLFAGDRSDARNPVLVQMFRYIGLAEEAGTGIPKIIQAWRALGYRAPSFVVDSERYEFALVLRHAHLLSNDDRRWLDVLGGGWSEAEQLALIIARHEGTIDNVTLRKVTGQHPADITKVLGGLRSRGLLHMFGSGRGAWYQLGALAAGQDAIPGADQLSLFPENEVAEVSQSDTRNFGVGSKAQTPPTVRLPPDSELSLTDSTQSLTDSTQSLTDSTQSLTDSAERLRQISARARSQRHLDTATLEGIIIDLCAIQPLSRNEISQLTGRSQSHTAAALQALVSTGRLVYLYPETPSHPGQRYVPQRRNADTSSDT